MTELLEISDIALPSWPDERVLFGDASPEEACRRLRSLGVSEVALKLGADGVLIVAEGVQKVIPGLRNIIPLDTTGAGGGFNGAYLAARLIGHPVEIAARIAIKLAAEVIEGYGALAKPDALRRCWAEANTRALI